MLILEKIRAICQQNPEYRLIVRSHDPSGRAKDFFDIYLLNENYPINLSDEKTQAKLKAVFEAKKVPLAYIRKVKEQKELHSSGYESLKDTVKSEVELKEFDYYFDYVVGLLDNICI